MYSEKIKKSMDSLLGKYQVACNEKKEFVAGCFLPAEDDSKIPLQTWRLNRKFVELQKLISGQTVEHPCMFRFCAIADRENWTVEALMYREFDLCEFIGGSPVVSVHAVLNDTAGSVIAKLANGVVCSIEIGARLEPDTAMIDRHEIIARRGVASDIVVDTQLPQSSIYTFTPQGKDTYKDVDNELYGLDEDEVAFVRSVFEYCKQPSTQAVEQHRRLWKMVAAAVQSNNNRLKVIL